MFGSKVTQLSASLASAMILSVNPFSLASAQLFPSQRQTTPEYGQSYQTVIPTGTVIPVFSSSAEKILVTREETLPLTLQVAANVRNREGRVLIPYGAEIVGEVQPSSGGSRFVAFYLVDGNGARTNINANSRVITTTEVVNGGSNTRSILRGAVIGAAAATVIAGVTGDRAIATEEVLGGAGLGAVAGWVLRGSRPSQELISIDPNQDLEITLTSDLLF